MINLEDYLDKYQIEYFYSRLELLKENNYDDFYYGYDGDVSRFTDLFLACGVNPLEHMTYVPRSFAQNLDIESIEIPEGILYVDEYAFTDCWNLSIVKLSNSLEEINDAAFYNCVSLEEIEIPENVVAIWGYVFYHCKSLKKVRVLSKDIELSSNRFPFKECPEDMLIEVRTQELADIFEDNAFTNFKLIP